MVDKKTIRIVCAAFTFPSWYFYYNFLHNFVRSCDICLNVLENITSTLKKVVYLIIMYCCGFSIIQCILCVMGCIHCFKEPCQKYQAAGSWYDAFYAIVNEKECDTSKKIHTKLKEVFT